MQEEALTPRGYRGLHVAGGRPIRASGLLVDLPPIQGQRQPLVIPPFVDVSDLLHPHQRAPLAEIAGVTELPAARQIGVPQPEGFTVVPAKRRFEASGLRIRLCCLPTYDQERLFGLELFPPEYLHGIVENLSPPRWKSCALFGCPRWFDAGPGPWNPGAAAP